MTGESLAKIKIPIFALALVVIISGTTDAVRKSVRLDDLAWLAGHWSNDTLEVFYTDQEHGAMLGVAKPVSTPDKKQGRQALQQRDSKDWDRIERFSADSAGVLLRAYVRGEFAGEYVCILAHRRAVTFESSVDDSQAKFPLRITYRLTPPDTLRVIVATNDSVKNGEESQSDTTVYTRVPKK